MDADTWRQIEELYHAALEKEPGERGSFLDERCAGRPELRREVESLLAVTDDADGYLKAAVLEATPQAAASHAAASGSDSTPEFRKLGRYEIQEQVGKGGMGVVYRGVDPTIGRTVAIKTIRLDLATESKRPELRARLRRESQAGGQLSHPNIVAVYDVGEEGDVAYIVMEYVVGRTLEQVTAGDAAQLPTDVVLRIIQDCAGALDYAHSRGVVHRDIKPANLMLRPDGSVKIADFGIAKAADLTALTQSAVAVGSPQYMAPEQWKGGAVTGKADQYALAAVAFALLTGRRPFESETIASLAAQTLYQEPPAASSLNAGLPPALDPVLGKALAKDPSARYQNCGEFAGALLAACRKEPSVTRPAVRRSRLLGAAAAATVLIASVASGWLYLRSHPAPSHAIRPPEPPAVARNLEEKAKPQTEPDPKAVTPTPPAKQKRAPKVEPPSAADPYARAATLLKQGSYAEAIPYFTQAIARKPEYRSYFGRAGAYQHMEKLDQAIADYTQAIRLNPAVGMPYHERAVCLARLGRDDQAFGDYNKAIELSPDYALSWNGRGVIELRRKAYENAVADFNQAIKLNPELEQAYRNRASGKRALGDKAGAEADLSQAKTLKP